MIKRIEEREYRKLHITVPNELFSRIKSAGLLGQIDSIMIEMLKQYLDQEE